MNAISTVVPRFQVNPEIDPAALASEFRRNGHLRIPRFFVSGAPELYRHLEETRDWLQVVNHEGGAHEVEWTDWIAQGSRARADIEPEMFERARDGFQYSYAALRIPPPGESSEDPFVDALAAFVHGAATLDLLSEITGIERPRFTDGQVTAYGEGDFLTGHDDDLAGSGREAAFVLGLTPQWRLEWGGLLLFHELGQVNVWGMVPQFNTLDLFAVPKYHSVSMVTRAAPRRRYSVTGWISSGKTQVTSG